MRSKRAGNLLALFICLIATRSAFSTQVLKVIPGNQQFIAVSLDKKEKWRLNESICVIKKTAKAIEETDLVGCGQVIRITRVGMILALDAMHLTVTQGESVLLRATERATAAQEKELSIIASKYEGFSDSKTFLFGVNLLSPYVRFEQLVFPWLGLGIMPSYLLAVPAGNGTLSGPAMSGTFSFYPHKPFEGFNGTLSIGGTRVTAKTNSGEEGVIGFIISPSVGWRFHWENGLDVGLGAGLNYFKLAQFKTSDIDFNGFSPFAFFDFGFTF